MSDIDSILSLYAAARQLQTQSNMVVWPVFKRSMVEKEIQEKRQWKIVLDNVMACNWAIAFMDREIWGERDKNDAVYIHRICTNPTLRGNRYVDTIVGWAKGYARETGKQYIRLDTLGDNKRLIEHYTSAGFSFLGMHILTDTASLPGHYQKEPNCALFEIDLMLSQKHLVHN
jgi:hypothetical protein